MWRSCIYARNSLEWIGIFQEEAAIICNDETHAPESRKMPDAYEKFGNSLDLSKIEGSDIAADKVKTAKTVIKPKMHSAIFNYEKSDNNGPDWGDSP